MKYVVVVPKVDVLEDENYTRRIEIMIKGSPVLNVALDEQEYEFEYDLEYGREMRVRCGTADDVEMTHIIGGKTASFACHHFSVFMEEEEKDEDDTDEFENFSEDSLDSEE